MKSEHIASAGITTPQISPRSSRSCDSRAPNRGRSQWLSRAWHEWPFPSPEVIQAFGRWRRAKQKPADPFSHGRRAVDRAFSCGMLQSHVFLAVTVEWGGVSRPRSRHHEREVEGPPRSKLIFPFSTSPRAKEGEGNIGVYN